MLDASIVHFMQSLSTAITPWLVGSAVGFLMLWLILLFGQMNAFAKPSAWFSALTPLKKVVAVATICLFAMWGGSKEGGDRGAPAPVLGGMHVHEAEHPDFAVTDLCFTAISPAATSVFVSVAWPTNWTLPMSLLAVYARHDLADGAWEMVADASVPSGASAVDIEIPHAMLPEGGASRAAGDVPIGSRPSGGTAEG